MHGYKLYILRRKDNYEFTLSTNKEAISNATMNFMESSIWLRMNASGKLNTCNSNESCVSCCEYGGKTDSGYSCSSFQEIHRLLSVVGNW